MFSLIRCLSFTERFYQNGRVLLDLLLMLLTKSMALGGF